MPSGISCHSFSARKAAESSYLISFSFFSSPHRHLHRRHPPLLLLHGNTFTSSLGLNGEISQQQSLSPLIKSAAKPSGVEEAQYLKQMNNPPPCSISKLVQNFKCSYNNNSRRWKSRTRACSQMRTPHTHKQAHSRTPYSHTVP